MTRLVGTLVLLTLFAPLALAAPANGELAAEMPKLALPDMRPLGDALSDGADAVGDAAGSAVRGIGRALAAVGSAIAAGASALGQVAVALTKAVGTALVLLGGAIASSGRFLLAHPKESAAVAGSATGAGLFAWAAKKWWISLFVPLYSRLAKSDMLENRVRSAVFDHVKAHPGVHPSAIAETLGLGWGTVVYHLARLEDSQLVTVRSAHNRKCYFAVGGELDNAGRAAVAAMSTDKARAIVEALRAEPGLSQKALADKLGMSQALASWHVKRLVQSGVLISTRVGRSNTLAVAGHVPVVTTSAPALAA